MNLMSRSKHVAIEIHGRLINQNRIYTTNKYKVHNK